jgi:hypothetical protein
MLLTKTKDVLSLAPYLTDITSCTIYAIVQDGIDLIAHLEKKQHLHC